MAVFITCNTNIILVWWSAVWSLCLSTLAVWSLLKLMFEHALDWHPTSISMYLFIEHVLDWHPTSIIPVSFYSPIGFELLDTLYH